MIAVITIMGWCSTITLWRHCADVGLINCLGWWQTFLHTLSSCSIPSCAGETVGTSCDLPGCPIGKCKITGWEDDCTWDETVKRPPLLKLITDFSFNRKSSTLVPIQAGTACVCEILWDDDHLSGWLSRRSRSPRVVTSMHMQPHPHGPRRCWHDGLVLRSPEVENGLGCTQQALHWNIDVASAHAVLSVSHMCDRYKRFIPLTSLQLLSCGW